MNKKEMNKNSFLRDLWGLLDFCHKKIYVLIVFTVFLELARYIWPFVLKHVIDILTNFDNDSLEEILFLVFVMFLGGQLISIFAYFKDLKLFQISYDIQTNISISAHRKLLHLSLSYHEKENTGKKLSRLEHGVQKIVDMAMNMSWEVFPVLIQFVVTSILLFLVDYRFTLVILFFIPLFSFVTFYVNKKVYPMRKKEQESWAKASGVFTQSIININTVKSFTAEDGEFKKYSKSMNGIKKNGMKGWNILLKFNIGRNFLADSGRISILLLGVYFLINGQITIGTLVFVMTISEKLFFSMYRLTRSYDRIQEGVTAVERLIKIYNSRQDIIEKNDGAITCEISGEIKFVDVNFSYNDEDKEVLRDINFKIIQGSTTALVGPSGGGKTTLARMIYRHYDPQKGEVLLDDVNLKDYDLYSFRKQIAIVPQEVEIFDTSIAENIAYGKPDASSEEIKAVARIANAAEFIEKLKNGYKTQVGERGIKLSGGQRQRVGIARAILANPKILIFDEATSSLDSFSERLIQDAMSKITKNRTVIIIAHRLSTIKKADKIVVLEEGRIVEQGSHIELLRKDGGLYSKLLKLQEVGDVE